MGTEATTQTAEVTTQAVAPVTETTTTTTETAPAATTTTETPAATVTETPKVTETPQAEAPKIQEAPKAPEKYELKTAEGSLLKPEQVKEIEALARSANLSNEQAQALLTKQESGLSAYKQSLQDAHTAEVAKWKTDIEKHPELGGANLGKTLEHAKQAMDYFADADFKAELDKTGYGNHPGLVKVMAKIGSMMSNNQSFVKSTTSTQQTQRRAADILYKSQE